jgi:hypothetical protein
MMISFRSPLTPDAVEFLTEETRVDFGMQDMRHWFCATAWNDTGSVIGVLACEPKTWFDWHWSCAVADPHVLSRRLLRTIFRTLFKAGAVRITARTPTAKCSTCRATRGPPSCRPTSR